MDKFLNNIGKTALLSLMHFYFTLLCTMSAANIRKKLRYLINVIIYLQGDFLDFFRKLLAFLLLFLLRCDQIWQKYLHFDE
jgi:hypothetical protein